MERKYGPKPKTKDRDTKAKRYVARKAKFGEPLARTTTKPAYVPKAVGHAPTSVGYKPKTAGVGARATTASYVKRPYIKTPYQSSPRARAYAPSALATKRPYVKRETPTRGAFGAPRTSGYVAKKTYTPKLPASQGGAGYVAKRTYAPAGERKAYARPDGKTGIRPAPYERRKQIFKSVVPNKPKTASASWGEVATWYDKHLGEADTYHDKVILPNLLRLIAPKNGDTIIDLACGQGYFTRALADKGAHTTGVDIAPELIAIAKAESPLIPYLVSSAAHISEVNEETFNKALISLSIQNIEHTELVMSEAARVLKPGGELHIVMNHPAFRIPKASSWSYDDKKQVQYRRVDQYLSNTRSEIEMHPGMSDSPKTVSFHRPLQFYVKALTKAGFAITKLEEWISHKDSDSGPRARAENNARKEIPLFLYLKATKQ